MHTVYNDLPIYDSLVANTFRFPKKKAKEDQIDWSLRTYGLLVQEYSLLLKDER